MFGEFKGLSKMIGVVVFDGKYYRAFTFGFLEKGAPVLFLDAPFKFNEPTHSGFP